MSIASAVVLALAVPAAGIGALVVWEYRQAMRWVEITHEEGA